MPASDFQYFNPVAVLQKLHGDPAVLARLARAYRQELPQQISQLQPLAAMGNLDATRGLLHQLRATFGMFEARRAAAIERHISLALHTQGTVPADHLHSLACEMIGLDWELEQFLKSSLQAAEG
ncbi:hypothetical protein SAMN02745857_00760 [Andreprevotia lacus DSM 23236]|jgi:hypothetical protein|uniref:Hpt domain-containing protein n=1 Tax=Andreprevotia lacus DSM 23236 TaxID=1121001 RepID=A0A1W1X6T5_9NEIS|nr:hypothetical protein [Andreprevotia lacus]SMC19655.1 hypothetical protein SAMN02745857_00760 [Andreprevotia lacus DSM 23236]